MQMDKSALEAAIYFDENSMPYPKGWQILCVAPRIERKIGNVWMPDELADREQQAVMIFQVVKVGDVAYKDEIKFPSGAWCKEGDYVLVRSFSGVSFHIGDNHFRIINDDQVQAVVPRPDLIRRA